MTEVFGWDARRVGDGAYPAAVDKEAPGILLEPRKKFRVRLVGMPVLYMQYFAPIEFRPEDGEAYEFVEAQPLPFYAMFVIDRADNELKIIDFNPAVFSELSKMSTDAKWSTKESVSIGGGRGIEVTFDGLSEVKKARQAPFTEMETAMISSRRCHDELLHARRPHTWPEVMAKLEAKGIKSFDRWDEI